MTANYQANRLVIDPNRGFGRNLTAEPLKEPEERHAAGEDTYSDDDGGLRHHPELPLCVAQLWSRGV